MATRTHTPGPWSIRRSESGYPYQIVADESHGNRPGGISNVTRWGPFCMPSSKEGEANARLVAAAPDFLAACKLAKDRFDQLGLDWLGIELDPLTAAIAKATEETHG